MNNIFLKNYISRLLLSILIVTFGMMSSCKSFDEPEQGETIPEAANISIHDLHTAIDGRTVIIEQDIIIGGYVTSSDEASNFHRTFTIEDASGGVEIMAGLYDLHNIYPKGYYVTISLKGCALGEHFGVMQVGIPTEEYSYYPTDYFASRAMIDRHLKRYNIKRDVAPLPLSIKELDKTHCGRLVNIDALTAIEEGVWSGYTFFSDGMGKKIAIYTSEYATYAQTVLPTGKVAVTGILQYGKVEGEECYIIKMRDEKDCCSNN